MLTGDYETYKAELERLIAHEQKVEAEFLHAISTADRAINVAVKSRLRYQHMLRELEALR